MEVSSKMGKGVDKAFEYIMEKVNSNCLYNQSQKEGNAIIYNEGIIKNYNNYYYSFNPNKSYSKTYEQYIKILFFK